MTFKDLRELDERIDRGFFDEKDNPTQLRALRDRSKAYNDGYGTHLPVLASILSIAPPGDVLEIGAGDFSTPVLLEMCRLNGRLLYSVEPDDVWRNRYIDLDDGDDETHDYTWLFFRDEEQWSADRRFAVVLIDQLTGPSRRESIEKYRNRADFIVVHDTHNDHPHFAGVDEALATFPHRRVYDKLVPPTTVVSMTRDVNYRADPGWDPKIPPVEIPDESPNLEVENPNLPALAPRDSVNHFWDTVEGTFMFPDFYRRLIEEEAREIYARDHRGMRFVEVGGYRGQSIAFLAVEGQRLPEDARPYLWVVEPSRARFCDHPGIQTMLHMDQVTLLGQTSLEAAEYFRDIRLLDVVFIDADHTYESVVQDIATWWPLVAPGGILAGHDFNFTDHPGVVHAVMEAIDANLFGDTTLHLERGVKWRGDWFPARSGLTTPDDPQGRFMNVWWVRKPKDMEKMNGEDEMKAHAYAEKKRRENIDGKTMSVDPLRDRVLETMKREILEAPFPPNVSAAWRTNIEILRHHARTSPLEEVLLWTNLVDMDDGRLDYFNAMARDLPDEKRWIEISKASTALPRHQLGGDPLRSPNSIEHAFHLFNYEKATGDRFIENIDVVVEVGGGGADFARLLRADGFKGTHVIIDLPQVNAIQKAFLTLNGIDVEYFSAEKHSKSTPSVVFCREEDLQGLVSNLSVGVYSLAFVATWSLSETPLAFRSKVEPIIRAADKILIATQPEWEGIDNLVYYGRYKTATESGWRTMPVPHNEGQTYLFFKKGLAQVFSKEEGPSDRIVRPMDLVMAGHGSVAHLRGGDGTQDLLIIDNFLPAALAEEVHAFLDKGMPKDWWDYSFHAPFDAVRCSNLWPNDSHTLQMIKGHRGDPELASALRVADAYAKSTEEFAADRIAYAFRRTTMHFETCGCVLCRLEDIFHSGALLNRIVEFDGKCSPDDPPFDLEVATSFASWYAPGDFLSPHSDKNNGDLAFVWNLTKDWRPQYGGNLHFLEKDWTKIDRVVQPGFNQLVIFEVGAEGIGHLVSHVAPGVTKKRLAFSGWMRKIPKGQKRSMPARRKA